MRGLNLSGFTIPSPVQRAAIPLGRLGADLVVQAKSGTGKTVTFGAILCERVDRSSAYPQALVLAPTREVALQSRDALAKLARALDPAPPPVPIGSLTSLQPGARARVQGRVTNVAPGRAQVRDVSGATVVTCGQAPPLGAWVDVTGRWSPTALTAESLEVVGLPARTFPAGDGEWLRVFGDGGRRLRALQVRAEARRTADRREKVEIF